MMQVYLWQGRDGEDEVQVEEPRQGYLFYFGREDDLRYT